MKKSLKIAFLGTRGIPNNYGGFEQCAEFLSQGLAKKDHDITVYCSLNHTQKTNTWNGVKLVYCNDPEHRLGTIGQFIYDLNCILHARKQRYDVIVQFGYTSSSIWHWLWPKKAKHLVNMDGLEFLRSKYSSATKYFLRFAEKWATKGADMLIADNEGIEDYLKTKYPSNIVKCITYGAALPEKHLNNSDVLNRFGLASNKYDLVICRMEPENSVETILKAHSQNETERKLVILGNTSNKFGQQMVDTFQSDVVLFTQGIYNATDLNVLRSNCQFYIHGHTVGGTNPSLLEAMTSCKKIIAHDNGFNRSVLGEDGTYFKTEKELDEIFSKNAEDIEDRLVQTNSKIKLQYQWEQIVDAYESAMYELV